MVVISLAQLVLKREPQAKSRRRSWIAFYVFAVQWRDGFSAHLSESGICLIEVAEKLELKLKMLG